MRCPRAATKLWMVFYWLVQVIGAGWGPGRVAIGQQIPPPEDQTIATVRSAEVPATAQQCADLLRLAQEVEEHAPLEALAAYDKVIASGKSNYCLQKGLYCKARLCLGQNCREEAASALAVLRQLYPDSSLAVQAKVLAAEFGEGDRNEAEQIWAEEQIASPVFDSAMLALREGRKADAQTLLEDVSTRYSRTAAALRSQTRLAFLLDSAGRKEESLSLRRSILQELGSSAPQSAIVQLNKIRAAQTLYGMHRKSEATVLCQELKDSQDPATAAEANVVLAAISFEALQIKKVQGHEIGEEEWEQVHAFCRRVMEVPAALRKWKVRAGLMHVEALSWRRLREECAQAGTELIARYDEPAFKRDLATVRLCVGLAQYDQGLYADALVHFRAVVAAYPNETKIWGSMDHLERSYCMVWRTLQQLGASPEEVDAAAASLASAFPDGNYTRLVQSKRKGLDK